MFALRPVGPEFFDRAPVRLVDTFAVARPAPEVWAELTGENPLSWCRVLQSIAWTSPRPFGVGATRTVRALGSLSKFHESFFRWEEGRRKSFYVIESRLPGFESFAEDYLVEPDGEGSCRFTWTIAYAPNAVGRPASAGNRLVLRTLFSDTRRHYGG